jgi:hypothetical protein
MNIVCVESPYAGNVKKNRKYAQACMLDSLLRGEAPIASHLLYTQVLNDNFQRDRQLGIEAGLTLAEKADKTVVYTDHGISKGMEYGIARAITSNRPVEYRSIL